MSRIEHVHMQQVSQRRVLPAVLAAAAVTALVVITFPLSVPVVILGALAGGITLAVSSRRPRDRALAVGLIGAGVGLILVTGYVYYYLLPA